MSAFREFFRSFATGNGSEVVLPWYPESKEDSRARRLIRASRREPEFSPLVSMPMAFIIWGFISIRLSFTQCAEHGKLVKELHQLSRTRQILQMLGLAWKKNVTPLDYYECLFFLPEHRKHAEYYIPPVRHGRLTADLNRGRPTERLDNKLTAYHAFMEAGIPTVEIVEIFTHDGSRSFGKSDEKLSVFLGRDLFVKPVNYHGGRLTERWLFDAGTSSYSNDSISIPADKLWETIANQAGEMDMDNPDRNSRLVQPLLKNHPALKILSKESLNTLRVCTIQFPDGRIEVYYAELRMGLGDEISDTGEKCMAGVLDLKTGCLHAGIALKKIHQRFPVHPDTGAQVEGHEFPLWEEVKALSISAHKAFPDNPIVGWDIAVTPDGPLVVEANCNPYMNVPQVMLNAPIAKSPFAGFFWSWMGKL